MNGWVYRYRAMRSDKPRDVGDDGDTVLMILDQGVESRAEKSLRLAGVWAPELRKFGGKEAARLADLVFDEIEERARARRDRWPYEVITERVAGKYEDGEKQTFARYVAHIWARDTREYLNETIAGLLSAHPEWGGGTGAAEAAANG